MMNEEYVDLAEDDDCFAEDDGALTPNHNEVIFAG